MTDLMSERIPQIVNLEIAIKADLPALLGVEADQRSFDLGGLVPPLGHIGEGAPFWRLLGTDQEAGVRSVTGLDEANVRRLLPHFKCGADLAKKNRRRDLRSFQEAIQGDHRFTIPRPSKTLGLGHEPICDGDWSCAARFPVHQCAVDAEEPKIKILRRKCRGA